MRKTVFGGSDQVKHNWHVQPKKTARSWKFRIQEEEELYYHGAKIKTLISSAETVALFSYDVAHITMNVK